MKNPENQGAMEVADKCDEAHTEHAIKFGAEALRAIRMMAEASALRRRAQRQPDAEEHAPASGYHQVA